MKTALLALCLVLATSLQAAEERRDLTLVDGTVLKRARIISIKDDVAVVVHAAGTTDVPAEQIELSALLAAQKEIAARSQEQKRRADAADKQSQARTKAARDAAVAREKFTAGDLAAKRQLARESVPARLTAEYLLRLKSDFPPQSGGSVRVRGVSITYDIPSRDIWDWYRGTFATATVESVPRVLALVRQRIDDDMQRLGRLGGGDAVRVQSEQTARWLIEVMQPYADQWQAIAPPPKP